MSASRRACFDAGLHRAAIFCRKNTRSFEPATQPLLKNVGHLIRVLCFFSSEFRAETKDKHFADSGRQKEGDPFNFADIRRASVKFDEQIAKANLKHAKSKSFGRFLEFNTIPHVL